MPAAAAKETSTQNPRLVTRKTSLNFPGRSPDNLTEIDTLMRHGDPVSRWVPVNPNHAAEVIHAALQNRSVGTLRVTCRRQSGRTPVHEGINNSAEILPKKFA